MAGRPGVGRPTTPWSRRRGADPADLGGGRGAAGWDARGRASTEGLYAAGPETALDLVREPRRTTPARCRASATTRPMAYLAPLLDDGEGDAAAGQRDGRPASRPAPWRCSSTTARGPTSERASAARGRLPRRRRPDGRLDGSDGGSRGDDAGLGVGGLDLLAGDAEQVHDRVEVGHVDRRVGGVADDRLGVVGDARARRRRACRGRWRRRRSRSPTPSVTPTSAANSRSAAALPARSTTSPTIRPVSRPSTISSSLARE